MAEMARAKTEKKVAFILNVVEKKTKRMFFKGVWCREELG
jgi:hypothetical protein